MNNSPFELFRRNLKPLMVFLTALALFAFVVLPVLDSYMRQNSGVMGEDVVATYAGTKLTRSRVDYFTRNHQSTVRFLVQLAEEAMARGAQDVGFEIDPQSGRVVSIGINQNPGFDTSMRTMMLATRAAEDGFELDDNSLQVWLEEFTGGMISNSDINAMLMQLTQNQMGRPHLYEQLRSHLLASLYINRGYAGLFMSQNPLPGILPTAPNLTTPQEQWENFLKLNRNAVVNTYGVLVNDFLDQTNPSPSESEITAVYEDGKDRDPSDQSIEPAFHRRYSAKFEYLVGDTQKFLDEEVAKLSEEEIRAEYERRLKGGEFQLPDEPEPPATETPPSDSDGEVPESTEETEADSPETPESSETPETPDEPETPETPEEPSGEADAPESESDAAAEGSEDEPLESAAEESAENAGDPGEAESGDEPSPPDQSGLMPENAVRLVVLQEESEASAQENPGEQPSSDQPAQKENDPESPADDKPEPPADEPSEPPADEPDPPADEPDPPTQDPAPSDAPEGDVPGDQPPADETTDDDEPRVESFEDVRQSIAEDMAGPAARARLEAALADVASQMRLYGNKLAIHQSNLSIGQGGQPPVKPNLRAIASELGLQYEIIGPYTEVSITDEPIANSSEIGTQFGGRGPSFVIMMYGFDNGQTQLPRQQLFAPVRTTDAPAGKQYVSWKIGETEAYTPPLAEVRDEVVMAIRLEEARELARAAAETIAKQASAQADKPLEEIVPEGKQDNVKKGLGPFTWMDSFGFAGATIGNVPELDSVGDEFMRTVFTSDVGEYGVAMNDSGRVVYVVKPTKFEPSLDELREQFKQPTNRIMAMLIENDAGPILSDFYDSIDEDAGFVSYVNRDDE